MPQNNLPVAYRVRKSYWAQSFLIVMAWSAVYFFFSFLFKGPSLTCSFFDWTISVIFLVLIFFVYGLMFRLDMTKEGFCFCGQLVIYKIPWPEIQRVEYKVDKYRRRGPNVEIWIYRTDHVRPIKMTFFMFEKGALGHFFDVLKACAPQAVIDPQVMEYLVRAKEVGGERQEK